MKTIQQTFKNLFLLTIVLSSLCLPLFAQQSSSSEGRRLALVVGNSAYQANPLKNPVNDAEDIATALRETGFEVRLVKDADSAAFERAVLDFASSLKGADTGLFYYAGHGVQVDGMNYLIPVSPRIDDVLTVKARAMPVDTVVGRMETSGVKTALVFLDSCRDNPFPGATRSGTRGLAVVAAPKTKNSMIAYATSPGDTAADGTGRNGIFSAAFLEQLKNPGTELGSMMKAVKANVSSITANKQNPRVDDGMKEDFFFADPARLSAQAKAKADSAAAEVASLERELADRKAQIAAAKSTSEKQKLELEQQKQQAVATAKKLEAENLAREAERQAVLAKAAREQAAARDKEMAAAGQRQDELAKLAQTRKAELEKLAQDAQSDNPDVLIETVERLEKAIAEVNSEYERALKTSISQLDATWQVKFTELKKATADPWESDAEFAERIKKETATVQQNKNADLSRLRSETEKQRLAQTASMQAQFDTTLKTLTAKRWILSGSAVTVKPGTYDRNAKQWPFLLGSTDPGLPLSDLPLQIDFSQVPDLKTAYAAIDTAVKANALAGELEWGIERQKDKQRYAIVLYAARIRNLSDNSIAASVLNQGSVACFTVGKRNKAVSLFTKVTINTSKPGADIFIDGRKVGTGTWKGLLLEGSFLIQARLADGSAEGKIVQAIVPGKDTSISVKMQVFGLGKKGPAGGYIFYDKGYVSDGWRYMEAATADQSTGIQWYNGNYPDIPTDTAIGSGKANTAAIIRAQGAGNYAARICDQLVAGGFDDWFLPSKDELDAMYRNLKKAGLGGFADKDYYWSSSQYDDDDAWLQNFGYGLQGYNDKHHNDYVRAVRAF